MWALNLSQELQWVPSVFGPKKEKLLPGYLESKHLRCFRQREVRESPRHTQLTYCFSPKNVPSG